MSSTNIGCYSTDRDWHSKSAKASADVASGSVASPLTPDELAQRKRDLIELLNSWESEGDEQEQRETLAVLSEALGRRRVASSRGQFP
jgi:hypothetical protein